MGKLRGLIAYLLPLLLVPLGTLGAASLYVALDGLGRAGGVAEMRTGMPGLGGPPPPRSRSRWSCPRRRWSPR